MLSMNRELIICRNPNALSKIKPTPDTYYIVASDTAELHNIAIQYSWVNEICWIEQMESFFNVAEDVKSIVDTINEWLASLASHNTIPAELLFWIKHAEGGLTTQRIQDTLLLINSYIVLLQSACPLLITILSSHNSSFEDKVLINTADTLNIPVKTIGKKHYDIKSFLKLFVREPYYITKFLRSKYSTVPKYKGREKEIVFQLCTDEDKHLAHTTPLMKSLEYKGYKPVALCWASPKCAMKLKDIGLEAEHLEKYGTLSSIISGDYKLANTIKSAKNQKSALMEKLHYRDVSIGPILWPSILFFFSNSVAQRYRLQVSIEKYYKKHNPDAIRFWTMSLPEGTIPLCMLPSTHNSVIFGNTGFHDLLDNPYNDNNDMLALDLKLVTGKRQKEDAEKYVGPGNKIVVTGQVSWQDYEKSVKKRISFIKLAIPSDYRRYILYDAGTILRGYLSVQEQVTTLTALLEYAEDNLDVALIVKPHPNHKPGILESLIKNYHFDNVYLLKKVPIFDCLNIADVLITKWSTVGIEAMYMGIPVISVCLDKEKRFAIYEDAAEYIYTIDQLNDVLYNKKGCGIINEKIDVFLKENFYRPNHDTPSNICADEIIKEVNNNV